MWLALKSRRPWFPPESHHEHHQERGTNPTEPKRTAPQVAVRRVVAEAQGPLSHTRVPEHLGETGWNPFLHMG